MNTSDQVGIGDENTKALTYSTLDKGTNSCRTVLLMAASQCHYSVSKFSGAMPLNTHGSGAMMEKYAFLSCVWASQRHLVGHYEE